MDCKHETIMVYEEVAYEGSLVDGVVRYDAAAPSSVNISEVYCLDCDETFDNVEAESESTDLVADLVAAFPGLQNGEDDVNGADLVDWLTERLYEEEGK